MGIPSDSQSTGGRKVRVLQRGGPQGRRQHFHARKPPFDYRADRFDCGIQRAPAAPGPPRLGFCIHRRNSALMERRHGDRALTVRNNRLPTNTGRLNSNGEGCRREFHRRWPSSSWRSCGQGALFANSRAAGRYWSQTIQCAIASDWEFLAAHPVRRSNSEAMAHRSEV
jgi:hypothetical protein